MNIIQPQNPNLVEITSPVQAKRGNRQFFDQKHKVSYISYSNGYVRREIKAIYTNYCGDKFKVQRQFPINARRVTLVPYSWGDYKTYTIVKEFCPIARMEMIDYYSTNYKGYKGSMSGSNYQLIAR